MSYYHSDQKGYIRDKYENYKDAAEVQKAVSNGDLKMYSRRRIPYAEKSLPCCHGLAGNGYFAKRMNPILGIFLRL